VRPDPAPEKHWKHPNAGRTSGVQNFDPQPGSAVRTEPITYPLAKYFHPHETEEYKA
jgi:hypothetical protein